MKVCMIQYWIYVRATSTAGTVATGKQIVSERLSPEVSPINPLNVIHY